jgi:hypothetical protein
MLRNTCKHHSRSNVVEWMLRSSSTPKIVHLGLKHKFRIVLHSEGLQNPPKISRPSFWVHWSRMDAFVTKHFLQLWHPKIVHSVPKHKFCIILHYEGFRNAAKHSQWIRDNWSRVYAFVTEHFLRLLYDEIVHSRPEHKFCIFLLS